MGNMAMPEWCVLNAFAEEQDDVGFLEDAPLREWVQEVANAPWIHGLLRSQNDH